MSSKEYVLIDQNGLIANRLVLEEGTIWDPPPGLTLVLDTVGYSMGGTLIDGNYTPPVPPEERMPDLTDWQLRRGLVVNGYSLEAIEASIKSIPDQVEREIRWTFWDRPTVIKWDNQTTQEFLTWLGIPTEYAKDMWRDAATFTL